MVRVFAYGTLKPGEINYPICDRWVTNTQPAIASGLLYQLPFGYPAMVACADGIVHGVILSFADSAILQKLDEFEQHDLALFQRYFPNQSLEANQYQRQAIEVFKPIGRSFGSAWVYLMTSPQVQQIGGVLLPDGDWKSNS
jgi:gamma-glutamylcyclotransferase (GGCT)/AIG2-like uncharacterized protein YtfP